jgi:hypothetical protein
MLRWSGVDFVLIGVAALVLSLIARHVLGVELGYQLFSWIGVALVTIGLWRILVKGDF